MTRRLIFTLLLVQLSCLCFAQRGQMGNNEQLTLALFNEISKEIQIDDATKEKLRPLYLEFMTETRPKKDKPPHSTSPTDKSEEEVEKDIKEQLAHAVNLAKLREEYYTKFRAILKPSQIEQMYDVERMVMMRIRNELGERQHNQGGERRHDRGGNGGAR